MRKTPRLTNFTVISFPHGRHIRFQIYPIGPAAIANYRLRTAGSEYLFLFNY
jgi:hypothetical protein